MRCVQCDLCLCLDGDVCNFLSCCPFSEKKILFWFLFCADSYLIAHVSGVLCQQMECLARLIYPVHTIMPRISFGQKRETVPAVYANDNCLL